MRDINKIIIHCTATPASMDLTPETLRQWHLDRGWSDCGYHYYIDRQGVLHTMRPVKKAGAHCLGENPDSIGVALAGGVEGGLAKFNFTTKQMQAMDILVKCLSSLYTCTIHGHNEFSNKDCPSFSVKEWFYG